MKKKSFLSFFMVITLSALLAACSESLNNAGDDLTLTEKSATVASRGCGTCNFSAVLTDAEKAGLVHMIQEEKVARDVYLLFKELYPNSRVFTNIAKSEQAHMDAVAYLLKGYGITNPVEGEDVGEFDEPFKGLYEEFIAGGTTLKEALEAGKAIEEMDIEDLEEYIAGTTVPNILQVYKNLLAGSENHLAAFTFNLSRLK
jgi:hypothetical protein